MRLLDRYVAFTFFKVFLGALVIVAVGAVTLDFFGRAGYFLKEDTIEGIVLHAFEGKSPFVPTTLEKIEQLKDVYGVDFGAEASHKMDEVEDKA